MFGRGDNYLNNNMSKQTLENRELFVEFCKDNQLIAANTLFMKQSMHYCTYRDKNTAEIITTELIQKYNSTPQQKARNRRVEITFLAPRGGPVATSMDMAENEE